MHPVRKPAQEDIHTPRQVRALIADDSTSGLKALARILTLDANILLVGTATDGCQAVRQTSILQPELVLMDYHMPHMDGIEATRFIKQFKNPPFVIFVTANNTPECQALAKAAGADGFVDKGGDLHGQLRMVFQELLGSCRKPFLAAKNQIPKASVVAADELYETPQTNVYADRQCKSTRYVAGVWPGIICK